MRYVPIKSIEQQAMLSVHRVRQGFVKARTAQANQARGVLGELKRFPESVLSCSRELVRTDCRE
jgi:transposase